MGLQNVNGRKLSLLLALSLSGGFSFSAAIAADSTDQRARIVESSLKDLSIANDAAIARQRLDPARGTDSLGNPKAVLRSVPLAEADSLVNAEVESSLHRLRRETVSLQTQDARKARVDESLDRASRPDH